MSKTMNDKSYTTKLWLLSTVVLAPLFLSVGASLYSPGYFNRSANLGVIFLFVAFGLVLSAPTFLVIALAFLELRKKYKSVFFLKTVIAVISIAGVFVTFTLIGINENKTLYILVYSLSILFASTVLPLRLPPN